MKIQDTLRLYLTSLTHLANENRISCAPILHWFECDNHGRNIPVPHALGGVADINIPAIAAASVIRRYTAQDDDELDLEVSLYIFILRNDNILEMLIFDIFSDKIFKIVKKNHFEWF